MVPAVRSYPGTLACRLGCRRAEVPVQSLLQFVVLQMVRRSPMTLFSSMFKSRIDTGLSKNSSSELGQQVHFDGVCTFVSSIRPLNRSIRDGRLALRLSTAAGPTVAQRPGAS